MKERLDVLLVQQGYRLIVIVNGHGAWGQTSTLEMFMWTTRKKINQEQHSQKNLRLKCVAIHCLMSAAADLS